MRWSTEPAHNSASDRRFDTASVFAGADSVSVHFLRDKIEESRLKCLWQQTAGTHRCGEAVIGAPC